MVPGDDEHHVEASGGIASYPAPFGRTRAVLVRGDGIVTGDGSEFQVTILDGTGAEREICRRPDVDRHVDAAAIAAHRKRLLGQAFTDRQRQTLQRLFTEWAYPERRPAYERILANLVDAEGAIWLEHYSVDGTDSRWSVLDQAGPWLGGIDLPAGLTVTQITRDHGVGTATDDLDVPYVRLYRLTRGGAGREP